LFLDETMLTAPLRWKKPRRIFVCSMTDLFAAFVPDDFIDRMFAVMALCPQHTFQILTKRPERMRDYFLAANISERIAEAVTSECPVGGTVAHLNITFPNLDIGVWPLPNAWLGTSVEDQDAARERIPYLLETPAAVRFLSCEPMLGPIDLTAISARNGVGESVLAPECWGDCRCNALYGLDPGCRRNGGDGTLERRIDWVICGGESGSQARPMHPEWARSLRDQCVAAGVPFFFKQWGEWAPGEIAGDFLHPERTYVGKSHNGDAWHEAVSQPDTHCDDEPDVYHVGKRRAGCLLDGREWSEFPKVTA
jgi:protein gp37